MTIELTNKEVVLLINLKVGELEDVTRQMSHTPILSKQKALPIITRIQELLELIPDPSASGPWEVEF